MKKMKIILLLCCIANVLSAQEIAAPKSGTGKAVEKAKKINAKSREISDASNEVADQARQTADNINNTAKNIKGVIKIFEPVLLHIFKKKSKPAAVGNQPPDNSTATNNTDNYPPPTPPGGSSQESASYENTDAGNSVPTPSVATDGSMVYGTPESEDYNADGTMNCGHQNNGEYGNCINLLQAKVVGMGEAADDPGKIDLIFFSQFGGLGYSFQSPNDAPTINEGVGVKSWRDRNETEIAETKLTIGQFEKIKTNPQLLNAVKNTMGFKGDFFTPNKMEGRVFAIKLMQDERQLNALLAVYNQYGTSGSKGYLKIKIKVQGIDKNGDGYADANAYTRQ